MSTIHDLQVGARIKLTEQIVNDDKSFIPTEHDLPAGLEGEVVSVAVQVGQVGVRWDNGSRLMLLANVDDGKWEVVTP